MKKKTKFQKAMKWMGIGELILLCLFLIWLFGFKIAFLKIDVSNPEQYIVKYRGKIFYGYEDYIWNIKDEKFIGFAGGMSNVAFKSSGKDNKKFIGVWNTLNVHLRGYGTLVREDIELNDPSSENISKILLSGDVEVDEYIKNELLNTLDMYNSGKVLGIPEDEVEIESIDNAKVAYLRFFHSKYNIYCWGYLYLINDKYYISIRQGIDGQSDFIPISNDVGVQIE